MKDTQKHPLKWLAVHAGDYVDLLYNGSAAEKVSVFDEMITMVIKSQEPKHTENVLTLARSHAMWDSHLTRKKELSQEGKKRFRELKAENRELKSAGGKAEEHGLFAGVGKASVPSLEEALAFGQSIGAALARQWHEWSVTNEWHDNNGNPINNWKRALMAYEKKNNPDYRPPETAEGT